MMPMAIKVIIRSQWQSLHSELQRLPERNRAERLRQLATAWLEFTASGNGARHADSAPRVPGQLPRSVDDQSGAYRNAMADFANSMDPQ